MLWTPSSTGILLLAICLWCCTAASACQDKGVAFPRNASTALSMEVKLINDLFMDYDPAVRPVINSNTPLHVKMDMAVHQVVEVDERNQIIKLVVWMRWYWRDEYLVWNPANYSGRSAFYIPASRVWVPDVTLYNSIKFDEGSWHGNFFVNVQSNGDLAWLFPTFIESSCQMDVLMFPFDTQKCKLRFGSWGYDIKHVNLMYKFNTSDLSKFINNTEWVLTDAPMISREEYYKCCVYPYALIDVVITIRRMPLFYIYNLLVPCILITCLNLFTFLLPVESGEKISLTVTSLLTMVVFLLLVSEIMPAQADTIPVVSRYFYGSIIIMTCSALVSVFVIHLHFRGTRGEHAPSVVIRIVVKYLVPLMCYSYVVRNIKRYNKLKRARKNKQQTIDRVLKKGRKNSMSLETNLCMLRPPHMRTYSINSMEDSAFSSDDDLRDAGKYTNQESVTIGMGKSPFTSASDLPKSSIFSPSKTITNISAKSLNSLVSESSGKRRYGVNVSSDSDLDADVFSMAVEDERSFTPEQEWAIISMVVDRIMFIMFLAATIGITVYVLYVVV